MGKGHHSCGVAVCRNTSINAKKRGLVIHFFRFPQDPDVKKEWIVKCCRADKNFNPNNARICSDHFTLDDYEDSLKARIMGKTPMKLKKNGKFKNASTLLPIKIVKLYYNSFICIFLAIPTLLLQPSKAKKQLSPLRKKGCRKNLNKTVSQSVDERSDQELMPLPESTVTSSHHSGKIKSLEEKVLNQNRKLKEKEESVQ